MEPTHNQENPQTAYIINENGFQNTPFYVQSPNQSPFTSMNPPPVDDKLIQLYSSLLEPESKEFVKSKLSLYGEAGRAYINSGQFQNAQKIFELLFEVDPSNEKIMVLLGRCLQVNQEYHRQIQIMKLAIEASESVKNDPYIWFGIAISYFKIENYTQAEKHFKHCLRVDPHFTLRYQIYLYLGIINKYNLQNKIAIEYFLMNLQDEHFQSIEMASLVLVNIGQCLESFQEEQFLYRNLVNNLVLQYNEAASCYNTSLCLISNNFIALKAISWLFFQNGKISDSQVILKLAVKSNQNQDREIYYMQARCLEQLGNYKEAMQVISLAIQQEPNNSDNFTVLGVIFNKLNMHMESFQSFQRAYQMDTSKIENLFNMALIYEVSKKYQDALKLYSKLLLLDHQDCIVLQRKACIESQNYQNLTEYQFQMRYPSFKPSAQIWIENCRQPKFNILHEVSSSSHFQGTTATQDKGEHNGSFHYMYDHIKKASLHSQSGNSKEADDQKNMNPFNKGNRFERKSSFGGMLGEFQQPKLSICESFGPKQSALNINNQTYFRSRNNSFNKLEEDPTYRDVDVSGQKGQGSPLRGEGFQNSLKDTLGESTLRGINTQINRLKAFHNNDQNQIKYEGDDGSCAQSFEKKEDPDHCQYQNSPKKDLEKNQMRKESDFLYGMGRKNSFFSNYGTGGGQYNFQPFGYSPLNGPIAKDSVDFINNPDFEEPLDNLRLTVGGMNNNNINQSFLDNNSNSRFQKNSLLGNQGHSLYQSSDNGNKNQKQDVFQ